MKRIFSDFVYSDDRIDNCFWADEVPEAKLERRPLQGAHKADVAIIGGGFTGLSAALHLAKAGVSVVVLEARHPGWGASGRNGGFCCLGGAKMGDAGLDRAYGKAARLEWRKAEMAAIELVAELLDEHEIKADRHSNGETLLAHRMTAAQQFDREIAATEENYGITPEITPKENLAVEGLNGGPFHGALTVRLGFGLHPRKYLDGLLTAAEGSGAVVFGQSPVSQMARTGDHWRITTGPGEVTCDTVLLATNGYSSEDLPEWMAGRYMPSQSSIIVTRPMEQTELDAQGWTSDQMSYDSRNLLHYFRLMPNRRFLFGMRGGLWGSKRSEGGIDRLIRRDFATMFPAWRDVEITHSWSGMVCLSRDLRPFCGAVPGQRGMFAGFAYHGNGVAMGSYTGALLADLALGRTSERIYPEIMKKPPRKFPFGRFRRAVMFPAYAGYGMRDLLG
ncbi:NAD(P)/FAD-dependent oxidoreductase [Aquicoccus sp. G2-2]|uniref:NAD(P)/FAD-dependent oxidoreductase n=1 Tax=Aquicoccus sp. G2-2 TaxID=3092120 RepID=UPI002ADF62FB|nr:FAD-binding oxidoreductase [Aquicoccus sp. G2-2]MEA1114901.1 FAD-binding oxidoreductase [Aquicoccus sp. G2-2]